MLERLFFPSAGCVARDFENILEMVSRWALEGRGDGPVGPLG